MSRVISLTIASVLGGAAALSLTACDGGGKSTVQLGYRGTGMQIVYDKSQHAKKVADIKLPTPIPPAGGSPPGPLPWRNVQVLNDITVGEFNRTMIALSTWVAGTGNCAYCHNIADLAADTLKDGSPIYTKLVSRRMLQMTRHINGQYETHVKNTGVTCYTCHRGKPIPKGVWFYGKETDYLRHYLDRDGARVVSHTVEPTPVNRSSVKQTEWTYALMISQSKSLGVGCTYCHNSRQFANWEQAPPQRVTAYHGILMLRDLNTQYLSPLQSVFPAVRRGPMGDAPKLQCITCHDGAYKPLFAAQITKDYPALWGRSAWNGVAFPAFVLRAAAPVDSAAADSTKTVAPAPGATAPKPAATPKASAAATAHVDPRGINTNRVAGTSDAR